MSFFIEVIAFSNTSSNQVYTNYFIFSLVILTLLHCTGGRNDLTLGMGGGSAKRKEQFARGKLTKDTLAEISNENGGDRDAQRDFETRSVRSAQSVLSQVQSLRGIHSARSLAALTKGVAKEMGGGQMPTIHESKKPFLPPKIVIVDDTKGLREEIRKQPGQLPYMHRNPAV